MQSKRAFRYLDEANINAITRKNEIELSKPCLQ